MKSRNTTTKSHNSSVVEKGKREIRQNSRRKYFGQCQNIIFWSAAIVLTIVHIELMVECLIKYREYPTYISSRVVDQWEADFPAITFCPPSNDMKLDLLMEHGFPTVHSYNYKGVSTWSSNKTGVTERELFNLITRSHTELLDYVYVRFLKADPATGKFNVRIYASTHPTWFTEQRHRSFGKCFTIHPDQKSRDLGIYYLKLYFKYPIKLYLHRNKQFLDLSGRMGYFVHLNESTQHQVKHEDFTLLPQPIDEDVSCKETDYDQCMYKALETHMLESHGCVVPWIMSNKTICTNKGAVNATFWIAWNRVTNQFNDCYKTCRDLKIIVGGRNMNKKEDNKGRINFYFEKRVLMSEENYFYTGLSLLAEIGGYLGLLLGVSFLNFASWVALLVQRKINSSF